MSQFQLPFGKLISMFAVVTAIFGITESKVDAQAAGLKQLERPRGAQLDVLQRPVHDRMVYNLVLRLGIPFVDKPGVPTAKELSDDLAAKVERSKIKFPPRAESVDKRTLNASEVYERMVRSSLIIGTIYDCGKCDKLHVSTAGGVVIRPDGLVLTNHHVMEQEGDTKAIVAVTHDGKVFPVTEVLSASASDDVALVRLGGETSGLSYSPIASDNPKLMTSIQVLSHPHRHYFVLTEGKISRYAFDSSRRRMGTVWMEITADFGAGSSGSGVFNERGEVVGLVSRVVPLIRKGSSRTAGPASQPSQNKKSDVTEVILHRCVPVEAIKKRFAAE